MRSHPSPLRRAAAAAAVAAAITAAGCSSSTSPTPPASDITIVQNASVMTTGAFTPNPFSKSLATSGKVTWFNNDFGGAYGGGTQHHLVSDNGVFDLGAQNPQQTASFTFTAAGTYPYHCAIHPNMVGTITITP